MRLGGERVESHLKRGLVRGLERFASHPLRPIEELRGASPARILVIRQHDQVGDFLLATPALRAVRARWPRAHIALVVRGYFEDLLREHPDFDETLVIPEKISEWTPRRLAGLSRVARGGWDLAVVLNTVSHSLTSDLIAHLSRAPFVLGSGHQLIPGSRRNFFYNFESPLAPGVRHQSERNLDIVRYAGADTADLSEFIRVSEASLLAAKARLAGEGPLVGIHPGAGKLENRWPAARFAGLAGRLTAEEGARIALFWGPREGALAGEFRSHFHGEPILWPPGPLGGLAAAFAACDLLVVNDTGAMHIGAAAGTPLVAIFGPTNPGEWKPAGERFVAVCAASGRVADVTVDEVLRAVRGIFGDLPRARIR